MTVNQLLQEAVRHHASNQFAAAEELYRRVLERQPGHADASNLMGVIAAQRGDDAVAERWFQQSLQTHPRHSLSLFNYASLLFQRGSHERAAALAQDLIAAEPGNAAVHDLLSDIAFALGCELMQSGRWQEAVDQFQSAADRASKAFESQMNLAVCHRHLGALDAAELAAARARELNSTSVGALLNLGMIRNEQGLCESAKECYDQALALAPREPLVHNNFGVWHIVQRQPEQAIRHFEAALEARPDFPHAHVNLGAMLLLRGDFERGWREFEWRWAKWREAGTVIRDRSAPRWQGETLDGKTILLHAEQGLGDTLQFIRFAALVKEHGARTVLLECQPALARLLGTVHGVDEVFVPGDGPPPVDFECPLMSLPLALQTQLESIPRRTPYISADAEVSAHWQERLRQYDGLKVGLVWAGNPKLEQDFEQRAADRRRSLALQDYVPLLRLPGVRFFSLQKDAAATQIEKLPAGAQLRDFMPEVTDFADTACIVANLDLVITVDTSVAHLAGAMGKPVWVLSRFDGCWRWLLDRDDSPWYPTLRLFRQERPGDWAHVVERITDELSRYVQECASRVV